MLIVWSAIWGILVFVIMSITIKYYLPLLLERASERLAEAPDNLEKTVDFEKNSENSIKHTNIILSQKTTTVVMLVVCSCFAAGCGYVASENAVSLIGMIKMTLAICVLSCAFITDMEFMMIPNMCSIVLIVCRCIIVVFEFVYMKEEALVWFLNSVIALVVSLLLLLIMAKVTQGGLGMGDVKLFSSLGFLCGIQTVCFTLMFAFLLCAIASSGLLLMKKKHLKDSLPLGPFIWLGYGMSVLLSII